MAKQSEKSPEKTPVGWFTLLQCAAAFDVTRQVFHQTYRPLIPADAIRETGGRIIIHLRPLIEAYAAKNRQAASGDEDDAVLYGGSDSPNLERLRAAKANMAEMDYAERQGTHADIRVLSTSIMRIASLIRRTGEILQRRFGNEAIEILNDGIQQAESTWKLELERAGHKELATNPDGGGIADASEPD